MNLTMAGAEKDDDEDMEEAPEGEEVAPAAVQRKRLHLEVQEGNGQVESFREMFFNAVEESLGQKFKLLEARQDATEGTLKKHKEKQDATDVTLHQHGQMIKELQEEMRRSPNIR